MRVKGQLMKATPYRIHGNGENSMKVSINKLSGLNIGDYVYQEKLDSGIILLIPEKIYNSDN